MDGSADVTWLLASCAQIDSLQPLFNQLVTSQQHSFLDLSHAINSVILSKLGNVAELRIVLQYVKPMKVERGRLHPQQVAVRQSSTEIATLLADSMDDLLFEGEGFLDAFDEAARSHNLPMLTAFHVKFKDEETYKMRRWQLFMASIKNNSLDIAQWAYCDFGVDWEISWTWRTAMQNDAFETVEWLIKKTKYQPEQPENLICYVVSSRMAHLLLSWFNLDPDVAISHCFEKGNIASVHSLLQLDLFDYSRRGILSLEGFDSRYVLQCRHIVCLKDLV